MVPATIPPKIDFYLNSTFGKKTSLKWGTLKDTNNTAL